jgi:hypothetical protein
VQHTCNLSKSAQAVALPASMCPSFAAATYHCSTRTEPAPKPTKNVMWLAEHRISCHSSAHMRTMHTRKQLARTVGPSYETRVTAWPTTSIYK